MNQSHRAKLFHAVMFVIGTCEIVVQMALALAPVKLPKPGDLLSVRANFVYVKSSGTSKTKRFGKGDVFLVVTASNAEKKKYALGSEIIRLTMLGPDNHVWERAVHAHVFSSDFDLVKTCD